MANNYFRFKQFVVHQEMAAMKVGTDGVLLGAWANVKADQMILDVGTGTGLIALMLAQRNPNADIVAIDVDDGAVRQAHTNFDLSEWRRRLTALQCPLQDFRYGEVGIFDHVICNPPYFNNAVKSDNQSRTLARHTDTLSYQELVDNAYRVTKENGKLSLVLPYESEARIIDLAIHTGWYPDKALLVRPTPNKPYVRILIEFTKQPAETVFRSELIIEDKGRHGYSDQFIELARDFYLAM